MHITQFNVDLSIVHASQTRMHGDFLVHYLKDFFSFSWHELLCIVNIEVFKGELSTCIQTNVLYVLQRHSEEDSPSAVCELLPTLERRDGLSGSTSLYHMNLSDPFALTPLFPNGSAELASQSSPTDRTVGSRTSNSKRTIDASSSPSPSSVQSAKKARRRTADRPPLVQHNAEKKQKESTNVSPILQQHNKTTVCVC